MLFFAAQKLDSAFLSVLIYLGYVLPAGFSKFQIFRPPRMFKNDFAAIKNSSFWKNKKKGYDTNPNCKSNKKSLFKTIFETFGTS